MPLDAEEHPKNPAVADARRRLGPALRRVTGQTATARGLPNPFYTEASIASIEAETVFAEGWAGIGFAHDAPTPGDAQPIWFLGRPLLLLRDADGVLRVFHNICRHRGMVLVQEARKIDGAIRCPYHSWCYARNGRLVSTPHVGGPGMNTHPDITREDLGLVEVPSAVWFGVVFVNLSGTAPPFREANAALIERWRPFDRAHETLADTVNTFHLDLDANWKLCVENYCESYHLPWVHPGLNSYSRLEDHYNIVEYGVLSGQGTTVYRPQLTHNGARFPDFDGLPTKWDSGAEYITLFPNVMLGAHRDHVYAILIEPDGATRTRERVAIFYADASALGPDYADLRARNASLWKEVFVEDIFVVEGMQAGRAGDGFDGGRFSPAMDPPTHVFHDWVARRFLGSALTGALEESGVDGTA